MRTDRIIIMAAIVGLIFSSAGCAVTSGTDEGLILEEITEDIDPDTVDNPFFTPSEGDSGASGEGGTIAQGSTKSVTETAPVKSKGVEFITRSDDVDGLSFTAGEEKKQALIEVTGGSGDGFSWKHDMPAGFELVEFNSRSVQIKGTPSTGQVGEHAVTITATDKGGESDSASLTFTLAVVEKFQSVQVEQLPDPCSRNLKVEPVNDGAGSNLWQGGVEEESARSYYELGNAYDIKVKVTGGSGPLAWTVKSVVRDSAHNLDEDNIVKWDADGDHVTKCVGCGHIRSREATADGEIVTFTMDPVFDGPLPVTKDGATDDLDDEIVLDTIFEVKREGCDVSAEFDHEAVIGYPNHSIDDLEVLFAYSDFKGRNKKAKSEIRVRLNAEIENNLETDWLGEIGWDKDEIKEWEGCEDSFCTKIKRMERSSSAVKGYDRVLDVKDARWYVELAGKYNRDCPSDASCEGSADMDIRHLIIRSKYWRAHFYDVDDDYKRETLASGKINFQTVLTRPDGQEGIFVRHPGAANYPKYLPEGLFKPITGYNLDSSTDIPLAVQGFEPSN